LHLQLKTESVPRPSTWHFLHLSKIWRVSFDLATFKHACGGMVLGLDTRSWMLLGVVLTTVLPHMVGCVLMAAVLGACGMLLHKVMNKLQGSIANVAGWGRLDQGDGIMGGGRIVRHDHHEGDHGVAWAGLEHIDAVVGVENPRAGFQDVQCLMHIIKCGAGSRFALVR
jgi:hypothetical protein